MTGVSLWGRKRPLAPRRSVVVSGIGLVSALGLNAQAAMQNLLAGKSGIHPPGTPMKPSGEVSKFPLGLLADRVDSTSEINFFASTREARHTKIAQYATKEALADAGLDIFFDSKNDTLESSFAVDKSRVAVNVGLGIPCLQEIHECGTLIDSNAHNKISPFFVPKILGNTISGQIAVRYGLQGGSHCVTSACTTGTHCIGEGFRSIERGDCDIVIAGAAESCVHAIATTGFHRLRALSTSACRPFDTNRDGFVIGEGGAILILEEAAHAARRLAAMQQALGNGLHPALHKRMTTRPCLPWHSEILGYGVSSDGYHITAPHPKGTGCTLCMDRALEDAGVDMSSVDVAFAHATGTPLGDEIELSAISRARQASVERSKGQPCEALPVVSFKGAIGHLLGAAGSVETALSICSLASDAVPGNIGLQSPIEHNDRIVSLPKTAHTPMKNSKNHFIALKNSFGFGGTNASLVFAVHNGE